LLNNYHIIGFVVFDLKALHYSQFLSLRKSYN
jgi:hypothetical protein